MPSLVSGLFGGVDTSAQEGQAALNERALGLIQGLGDRGRADILGIIPAAGRSLAGGFAGAADILEQLLGQQVDITTAANVGAQEQVIGGLPQFQRAILGQPVDFDAFQPINLRPRAARGFGAGRGGVFQTLADELEGAIGAGAPVTAAPVAAPVVAPAAIGAPHRSAAEIFRTVGRVPGGRRLSASEVRALDRGGATVGPLERRLAGLGRAGGR